MNAETAEKVNNNYEAMARRYRPTTYAQVVGQEHVARTLQNAIAAGRVAHAYLFCGAHGCGKTTMARIFACSLVCEKGPNATPCGECAVCRDVMRGRDSDVLEIDGASNNGVEQVRSLREQAAYIPTRARYKIYIIDEVHMLSVAAFNALLKTLEEPPAHVKFILATTDPQKIPGTILSRCQRFDFRLVPAPKLTAFLKELAAKERAEITDDALAAVAAFSGGSVRDSLVLLDQLLSYCGGKVTREDVEKVRGIAGAEIVAGLFEAVCGKDLQGALRLLDEVVSCGTNCGDFLDQLISFGRDLMQVTATGRLEQVSAYGPALNTLKTLANSVSLDQTMLMLDVFCEARVRVRSRALSNPLVALEMAVTRLAGMDNLEPLRDIISRLDGTAHGARPAPAALRPPAPVPSPVVASASQPAAPSAARPGGVPAPAVSPAPMAPWENPASAAPAADGAPDDDGEEDGGETAPVNSAAPARAEAPVPEKNTPAHPAAVRMPEVDISAQPGSIKLGDYTGVRNTISVDVVAPADDADEAAENAPSPGAAPELLDNKSLWEKISALVTERNRADRAFLGDVYIDRVEGDKVFLSLPGGGSFIYEQLEDAARKKRLADAAGEVLGRPVAIHLKARDAVIVRSAQAVVEKRREVELNPQVQMVLRNFNGTIQDIILGDER